jgi:hypothetical protein
MMKRIQFARGFVGKETFKISLVVLFELFFGAVILSDQIIAHAAPKSNIPGNPGQPIGGGPIANPPPIGSPREPLRLRATGRTYIDIEATVPKPAITNVSTVFGGSKLYRQQEAGTFIFLRDLSLDVREQIHDEGLRAGTRYCYRLDTTYNGQTTSDYLCVTTEWRVEFANPVIAPEESQRVLGEFKWRETRALLEGPVDEPYLYYMNVLIDDLMAVSALKTLGVHVQASPIFPQELESWNDAATVVTEKGRVTGRWYFAVVPGFLFNEIRSQTLSVVAKGQPAPFRAIVFRAIPTPAAKAYVTDRHSLSYRYLGEQGFDYNATPSCKVEGGVRICSIRQELIGYLLRKGFEYVAGVFDDIIEGVRGAIGRVSRLVKGEVNLDLSFRLINTDPIFGYRAMHSAWRGKELLLSGVRVHVRQGVAAFYGHTDKDGRARLVVAKNAASEVCVELENDFVKLTEFLLEKLICVANIGSFSADHSEIIEVQHPYFNVLAQMTDAAEYVERVTHHHMEKITVLVGSMADGVALADRAFAPCMGRMPNLIIGGSGDLLASALSVVLPGIAQLSAAAAEFLYSVDIVLPSNAARSRGVGVHEYGHAVMCSMLAAQGFETFQIAWTDVIIATADQTAGSEAAYIAEAFADFLTSQVVGGTNYFATANSKESEDVEYCRANIGGCIESGGFSNKPFNNQIARIASLLHDAFDGHAPSDDRPNDGAHWYHNGSVLVPATGKMRVADDEPITLHGLFLRKLFDYWSQRGNTLREASFAGGLQDLLRDLNYLQSDICQLFSLHAVSTACTSIAGSAPSNLPAKPGTKTLTPASAQNSSAPGSVAGTLKRMP